MKRSGGMAGKIIHTAGGSWCAAERGGGSPSFSAARTGHGCCLGASSNATSALSSVHGAKQRRKPALVCACMNFSAQLPIGCGARSKIVQFWRMDAAVQPTWEVSKDIAAVNGCRLPSGAQTNISFGKLFSNTVAHRRLRSPSTASGAKRALAVPRPSRDAANMENLQIKRVNEQRLPNDGHRILVDRLATRGQPEELAINVGSRCAAQHGIANGWIITRALEGVSRSLRRTLPQP